MSRKCIVSIWPTEKRDFIWRAMSWSSRIRKPKPSKQSARGTLYGRKALVVSWEVHQGGVIGTVQLVSYDAGDVLPLDRLDGQRRADRGLSPAGLLALVVFCCSASSYLATAMTLRDRRVEYVEHRQSRPADPDTRSRPTRGAGARTLSLVSFHLRSRRCDSTELPSRTRWTGRVCCATTNSRCSDCSGRQARPSDAERSGMCVS